MKKKCVQRRCIMLKILLTVLVPGHAFAQKQEGYVINGKIAGLKENEKVIMSLVVGYDFKLENRDSAHVKNGEFVIKGYAPDGPRTYSLIFEKHPAQCVPLFIDNGEKITISCAQDIGKIPHSYIEHFMEIDGSPSNYAKNIWGVMVSHYGQSRGIAYNYLKKISDSVGFDPAVVEPILTIRKTIVDNIYYTMLREPEPDHKKAIAAVADEGLFESTGHAWYWKQVYDSLDQRAKTGFSGKRLKEKVQLSIGLPFPEFNLPTPEGKNLTLKEVLGKGKLTLVQFWASNSFQVDKFQEELLAMYKKYHDKGLNIVGISADTVLNKWKAGIVRNDLPWSQVSDLKGANGVVNKVYKEFGDSGIPNTTNVLIDEKGNIFAWDISGLELQWTLWKYFSDASAITTVNN